MFNDGNILNSLKLLCRGFQIVKISSNPVVPNLCGVCVTHTPVSHSACQYDQVNQIDFFSLYCCFPFYAKTVKKPGKVQKERETLRVGTTDLGSLLA